MLGWLRKNPLKTLEREYAQQLERARDLQRKGDIPGFAKATEKADALLAEIQRLEAESNTGGDSG